MAKTGRPKRQFTTKTDEPKSYDRKVRVQGHTLVISLGKIIPHDWTYVRLTPLARNKTQIKLLIERLVGAEDDAQVTVIDKSGKQDA